MAAPDAKPSPSSKEVQQTSEESTTTGSSHLVKEDPPSAIPVPFLSLPKPTYDSSETSEKYLLAKALLTSGDFEKSLELIEEAIQETRALLVSHGVEDTDLHESMAPFHYLYGTTLLYSIEESNDTQMMTVAQEGADADADADVEVQPEPPQDEEQEQEDESSPAPPNEPNVEDMEIAWENLDTARNIVEAMLAKNSENERTEQVTSKLQLDLAQILLREGDLQRMNGRYPEAILDYEACLTIRKLWLPPFDRKIADAQYNLGLSYLSNSTELQKEENPEATKLQLSHDHCHKGVQLYLECAHTLCGQIASLCAVDHKTIVSPQGADADVGVKTTGMEPADLAMNHASQTLNQWRKTIASLKPVEDDDPRLADLKELLDEIQETIDEAESSQQAVREASQLKHNAQKAITQSEDGTTSQIGFGEPTISEEVLASAAASAKPLMVVKKKKKRDLETTGEEVNAAKRTKTE